MFQKEFEEFIEREQMLCQRDKVLVGVSGGADSVCLLLALLEVKECLRLELLAVHIHHGIRTDSAQRDADFVRELCETKKVPFRFIKCDVPRLAQEEHLTEEEAGRRVRYEVFYDLCEKEGFTKIAVAHNQNDNAETVLFHLCRGSGLAGLSGIQPVQKRVIRPLLFASRKQIEQFLLEKGQLYCTDPTNKSLDYTRNRIRIEILPLLEEKVQKQAISHITKAARKIADASSFLFEEAQKAFLTGVERQEPNSFLWREEAFFLCHNVLKNYVARLILEHVVGGLKDISEKHINQMVDLFQKETGKQIMLPNRVRVVRRYDGILVLKEQEQAKSEENLKNKEYFLQVPGKFFLEEAKLEIDIFLKTEMDIMQITKDGIFLKNGKFHEFPKNHCTKWFDYDKIKNTVSLRTRRQGDEITLYEKGGGKKLKDYFIDQKVPREQRDTKWLLMDGNKVLWILGDRASEAYRLNVQTRTILVVQIKWEEQKNGGEDSGFN